MLPLTLIAPGMVQPVRPPIKGTSWPASARGFGLDSILGEHKHRIQTSRETTANHQTHHFSCRQKPSHLRSHATRRKMTIYFKRRVSSIADSLKSLYAMSSCGLQNEINGFLNCLKKVFSSCRIHLRTAIPDRELQHPCLCHFTKPIQIRIYTCSISSPV